MKLREERRKQGRTLKKHPGAPPITKFFFSSFFFSILAIQKPKRERKKKKKKGRGGKVERGKINVVFGLFIGVIGWISYTMQKPLGFEKGVGARGGEKWFKTFFFSHLNKNFPCVS
jgi:hypothetical protein